MPRICFHLKKQHNNKDRNKDYLPYGFFSTFNWGKKTPTGLCRFLKDDCGSDATKMKMAEMLNALPELLQNMYSLWHKRLPKILNAGCRCMSIARVKGQLMNKTRKRR